MADYLSRARTPTSPSPSPEPPEGEQKGQTQSQATSAGNSHNVGPFLTESSFASQWGASHSDHLANERGNDTTTGAAATAGSTPSQQPKDEAEIAREVLEEKIRIGVDDLMQLAVCAGDVQPGDEDIVSMKINETMDSLQAIQDATELPTLTQMVPEDVMGMIDQGRNPDIHTRTFTNRLNGDNQQMRGQAKSFDLYRTRLRAKIEAAFPEMKGELEAVDNM